MRGGWFARPQHLPNVERPGQFNKIMIGYLGLNT
jgi:hypothetical protein